MDRERKQASGKYPGFKMVFGVGKQLGGKMIKNKYRTEMIVFLVLLLLGGCLSIYFGQDNNYDLRNYHLYNAWSLMNGHLNKDILAAGIQTYF